MPTNIVSPTSKGQVTIPAKIRRELGINTGTLLGFELNGNQITITPIGISKVNDLRDYTKEEIDEFVKQDKVSAEDCRFFDNLLSK